MALLIMAGIGAASGLYQAYQGGQQMREGQDIIDNLDKPEFEIPDEIRKNMTIAEQRAYLGLPEAQKRAFIENQQRTRQAALRGNADRRGGLGTLQALNQNENLSNRQLLLDDTAARDKNIQRAMDARSVMAGYKMKRFEHKYNEYSADLDYARAMQGAGQQNVAKGINTVASSAMSFAGAGGFGDPGGTLAKAGESSGLFTGYKDNKYYIKGVVQT